MTNPIALDLLKLAEHYLSALHGSAARHDNIGLNLSCGGCALRDEIRDVLPKLAAAVSVPPPAPRADDRAAEERVRAVLESEAVVGRSALEYRGLIVSALMADEAQQPAPGPCVAGEQQNETPEAETPTTTKPETDQGAEIERLREQLDEAEDTAEQLVRNIQTVARERDSYRKAWKEEQQRRAQAAAKLRAVAEGLESDADAPGVVEIVRPALRDSARQIRAALAAGVRQDGARHRG